jgi:hypothetical protein
MRVMIVSCPKTLEEAIKDAAAGLERYNAERAFIRDTDGREKQDTLVERDADLRAGHNAASPMLATHRT